MAKVIFPQILKKVLDQLVINGIFNRKSSPKWDELIGSKIVDNTFDASTKVAHRNNLLSYGQADFTTPVFDITTFDLAQLYCYYYFQMHFTSTIMVFVLSRKVLIYDIFRKSNTIIFADIGCGPSTCGIAFLHFTRLRSVIPDLRYSDTLKLKYYGIDIADDMVKLGGEILKEYQALSPSDTLQYSVIKYHNDFRILPSWIGSVSDNTTIIINCCYFFASQSLDIDAFIEATQTIIKNNTHSKIVLFYQNADTSISYIARNFLIFRKAVIDLQGENSQIIRVPFSFEDAFNSTNYRLFTRDVRFQMLKNY
jgi:hypothetical protein